MKKILVIDDELNILKLLKEYLEMEGYEVRTAHGGIEAMKKLKDMPDLIILDVNMPDMDGYTVCKKIREFVNCPIIFLSARIEEQDRVNGFKVGGDDYVMKPFNMEELIARIEAHLRREERNNQKSNIYTDGELLVDFSSYRALVNGEDTQLTKTEFQIVELLITNRGQVFDKEKIYEMVRGYNGEGDASIITEHIRRIRKKLCGFDAKEYIETVWGVGYKWIG